ncbi:MAG: ribokinase [Bacillota bacterium]|jgi:ribokinase
MTRAEIVVVGSLNMDLLFRGERLPAPGETVAGARFSAHPGGKGANQAVAAARMGVTTAMVGCVGEDEYGCKLMATLAGDGVDCTLVKAVPGPSGCAGILVDSSGENCIVVANGANDQLSPDLVRQAEPLIAQAKVLLIQLEIPLPAVEEALALARAAGVTTVLDPAPARELSQDILALADFITPNSREASVLTGVDVHCWQTAAAAARDLQRRGVKNVLVTMGKYGAFYYSAAGQVRIAPPRVEAVDSTGAGDAFAGALAAALARGAAPDAAADWAAAAGALAATVPGALPSLPRRQQVAEVVSPPW